MKVKRWSLKCEYFKREKSVCNQCSTSQSQHFSAAAQIMPTHTDSDLLRQEDWETENIAVQWAITMYCRHSNLIGCVNVTLRLLSSFQVTSITQCGENVTFESNMRDHCGTPNMYCSNVFFFLTFIQHECIKVLKHNSKEIYKVKKCYSFGLSNQ